MKYYKLLFITLLFPFFSLAQSNYKPAYLVTLKGDTLHGFIDYKEWGKNPREFNFKTNLNSGDIQNYSVANVKAFAVTGLEYYCRFILPVSQDNVNDSRLSTGIDTSTKIDTVFLRRIDSGRNVSLYAYTDDVKSRYYAGQSDGKPVELIFHRFLDDEQPPHIKTIDSYKRQLQKLALIYRPDDPGLLSEIQNSNYSENALFKIASELNGANDAAKRRSARKRQRFFVGAGVNYSNISSKGENDSHQSNAKSSGTIFPDLNLGFDLYTNKNVGKLIFRTELSFTANKNQFNYNGNTNTGFPYKESVTFNQYIYSLNPQLLYNAYNSTKIKMYIAAGAVINYFKFTHIQDNFTDLFGTPTTESDPTGFPYPGDLMLNVTAKAGLTIDNKFQIYAAYAPPVAITDRFAYTLKLTCYQAGFNYLFGSK